MKRIELTDDDHGLLRTTLAYAVKLLATDRDSTLQQVEGNIRAVLRLADIVDAATDVKGKK